MRKQFILQIAAVLVLSLTGLAQASTPGESTEEKALEAFERGALDAPHGGHEVDAHADADADGHGDGHSDTAVKDTLYQAANLALLLGVLIYFGRKPVSEFFAGRREGIASELDEAAKLLSEAEKRNAELQRRLVDLNSEVEGIREESSRRAEEEAERILSDARAMAERIRRDAKAAVAQELRRAQSTLREEAADLAMEIAATKLAQEVGDADRDRLVDEFILRVEPNSAEGASS